jgi:hypothetical protein
MCSASALFPSLSVILVIWLSGFIAVPFSTVPLIILILMDSVSILLGTIIAREIFLTPLISKELDELTVLDKSFDQDPQGYASLSSVASGIMECAILVYKLWIRQNWPRLQVHRIPLDFHQNIHNGSIESGPVMVFE